MHGTGVDALAAADAGLLGILDGGLGVGKGQDTVGALHHGGGQVVLGVAHHGAAHQQALRLGLEPAGQLDEVLQGGADGGVDVHGPGHGAAGEGDVAVGEGLALGDRVVDGGGGGNVEHGAAHVGGQASGGHLTAGDPLDELLLSALGVPGLQGLDMDAAVGGEQALQVLHGVELVGLDADGGLLQAQGLHDEAHAAQDGLAPLQHEPVVGGDVGLALGAVDEDGVHLAHRAGELDVGGEARAAHTGDTGLLDDVDDLLGSEGIHIVTVLDGLTGGVLEIVLDDHGHHLAAAGMGPGLHGHDLAGDAGVNGSAETGDLADLLAHLHLVPHSHDGLAGSAHVHGHGDHHLSRSFLQRDDGLALRRLLVLGGVDAAIKLMTHSITSVITSNLCFRIRPLNK